MIDTDTSDDIIGYDINDHNNEAETVVKQRPNSLGSKLYQKRLQPKSYKNDDKPKQEELGYDTQFFDRKHDSKHLAATQTFGEMEIGSSADDYDKGNSWVMRF